MQKQKFLGYFVVRLCPSEEGCHPVFFFATAKDEEEARPSLVGSFTATNHGLEGLSRAVEEVLRRNAVNHSDLVSFFQTRVGEAVRRLDDLESRFARGSTPLPLSDDEFAELSSGLRVHVTN
jgi:hypothetical protein